MLTGMEYGGILQARSFVLVLSATAIASTTFFAGLPSQATDLDSAYAHKAMHAIARLDSSGPVAKLLEDVQPVYLQPSRGFQTDAIVSGTKISLPKNSKGLVRIQHDKVSELTVSLPNGSSTSEPSLVEPGIISYSQAQGDITTVTIKLDGSVELATLITSPRSSGQYSYDLGSPADLRLVLDDKTGQVSVISSGHGWIAGIELKYPAIAE